MHSLLIFHTKPLKNLIFLPTPPYAIMHKLQTAGSA
jgi:hypothetical protein